MLGGGGNVSFYTSILSTELDMTLNFPWYNQIQNMHLYWWDFTDWKGGIKRIGTLIIPLWFSRNIFIFFESLNWCIAHFQIPQI